LIRLSGTHQSWMRLNYRFFKKIRKHFLHWRAVSSDQRTDMYEQAKDLMEQHLERQGALNV